MLGSPIEPVARPHSTAKPLLPRARAAASEQGAVGDGSCNSTGYQTKSETLSRSPEFPKQYDQSAIIQMGKLASPDTIVILDAQTFLVGPSICSEIRHYVTLDAMLLPYNLNF